MTRRLPHRLRKALRIRSRETRRDRALGKTPECSIAAWTRWAVKKAETQRREVLPTPFGYTSFADALAVQALYDDLHSRIAENMRAFGWQPKPPREPEFGPAVESIVAFVQDKSQPEAARLNAATWLLDTALGKDGR